MSVVRFEDAYDQKSAEEFEAWVSNSVEWRWLRSLAVAHRKQDWPKVEIEARLLWSGVDDGSLKKGCDELACVLNLAVTGADVRYHLKDRERWISKWQGVEGWASSPYSRFIRTLQEGCGQFFTGSLREAGACFERCMALAEKHGYERGRIRSLLHLGLVARDQGAHSRARIYLEQGAELATVQSRDGLRARILGVMGELTGTDELERLFLSKEFDAARRLLLTNESKRRARGLLRRRQSLYIYLPLLQLWRGQQARAKAAIARIRDPILKVRVFQLKGALFGLEASESTEMELLQEIHGISRIAGDEICGIRIDSLESAEQRELLKLLVQSEGPVDKATIVQSIWGLSYDPVIHDRKAYKLIHALKKAIQIEDLILNRYGAYEINPKYLGQSRHTA